MGSCRTVISAIVAVVAAFGFLAGGAAQAQAAPFPGRPGSAFDAPGLERGERRQIRPGRDVGTRDGRGFQGPWKLEEGHDTWHDNWLLEKISNDVVSCPHWQPANASTNMIASGLAQAGRVRLYGINFDTDSAHLRADAAATLDQLKSALGANAAWRLKVEGHTDSTSTPAHNQDLSTRRAASVKAYLVGTGIAAAGSIPWDLGKTCRWRRTTPRWAGRRTGGWRSSANKTAYRHCRNPIPCPTLPSRYGRSSWIG